MGTAYTLHIQPGKGQSVKLILKDADERGAEQKRRGSGLYLGSGAWETGLYLHTGPEQAYSYVATKNTWYHAKKDFTLSDVGSGLTMAVKEVTAGLADRADA